MLLLIGTFNILNTYMNYEARRPYIVNTINVMNRDILGIQEVNVKGNTELQILETYQIEYAILPEPLIKPLTDFRIDGNALLIKHDIKILEKYSLLYESKQRIAQFLKLSKNGLVFVVANTHLDHLTDEARLKQVKELIDFSQQFREFPMICTGDYNFIPGSQPYLLMIQEFRSAYAEINGKEAEKTFPTDLEGVSSNECQSMALDYIWIRGPISVNIAEVFSNCGEGTIWASDHFPVIAELEILNNTQHLRLEF